MKSKNNLRLTQSQGVLSTLKSVEINLIDICNRSCSFCPQSLLEYTNKTAQMELTTLKNIATDLNNNNYAGRIGFVGHGEPLLYKNLEDAIRLVKHTNPSVQWIEVVTNGDYLSPLKVKKLEQAGCTNITVSMYDYDISEKIRPMFADSNIDLVLINCYDDFLKVNRNEIFLNTGNVNINRQCFIPFYKTFIDTTGDVVICSNDWQRVGVIGNVNTTSFFEIWNNSKMQQFRKELMHGNRQHCNPCKHCDVNGTTYGVESFQTWVNNERTTN